MYKFFAAGLMLFATTASWAQSGLLVLSEDICIEIAMENNIRMLEAGEELSKAKAQRREAFSSALPVLSGYSQASHNFSIASQPVEFPIPFGVLDPTGSPVPLTDENGNPVPFTDADGNPVPGMNLQMTGIQLVPFNMAFGSENNLVYGLSLTQPLFEGRVIAAIRGANAYDNLAKFSADVTRLSVIEATRKAFYQVLFTRKMAQVMENSLAVMEKNLSNVRALYDQGKIAEFDVIRAEVQVANQTTQVSNAQKLRELALAALKRQCGLEMDQEVSVEGQLEIVPTNLPSFSELEAKLLEQQPLLDQLQASGKLIRENVLMAKAEFMPSVALTGSYQQMLPFNEGEFEDAEFRESSSISIGLNMPLFNGFGSVARVQKAKADQRKAEQQLVDVKENLRMELQSIYLGLQESRKKIDAGLKGVSQAQKAVDMAQQLFKQGMANQLQILDAQNASDQAELGLYQAYYEYKSARASLARALGDN